MKSYAKPGNCPYCGTHRDFVSDIEADKVPGPGDISICIKCTGIQVFDDNMVLRKATDQEYLVYSKIPDVMRVRTAVLLARQKPAKN